ncbi:MAG TPA: CmpA/NrtA family ABC transporter substrate-binding protein [Sphingobium sp.]|nr:CmpA/NrtA family ABC transporter substrate-binding protein [Sphingobium sp.]
MSETLTVGFLPLVDAALPILAQVHGFAEDEGVSLSLVRDMSWATVLDRLLYGQSDAAHLIAPLAIATSLGINRPARPLAVPFVLGLNGNAITFANDLALAVQPDYALGDPRKVGERLAGIARQRAIEGRRLRFGVVHRYSSHNYMLRYWLAECGIVPDRDVEIVTVSPPFAAAALADGEVDGICVGEPWNSVAVEQGAGRIVLATAQIWRRGVEKVLAVPESRLAEKRGAIERLIRAMRRAGQHFINPANFETNAAILARPEYLGGDARIILRAISDRLLIARGGEPVHFPDFMFQFREAANFPWVSQAQWLYTQLVRWQGTAVDPKEAAVAARVFRPDIYRAALAGRDSPLPGASAKVEGAIGKPLPVGSVQGRLTLSNDSFFDGRQFDPNDLGGYLSTLP